MAVISGRSLPDVSALVGLPRIAYAGNHGLEIRIGRTHWVHPEAEKTAPLLGRIVKEAEFRLKSIPGTQVENKRLTASVHFRRARSGDEPEIRRILHNLVPSSPGPLKMTEGKKVIEIRPAVNWDKGRAVLFLAAWMDPKTKAVPLY
jgi:trehalose 6-phosphate phosphatase